MEQLYSLKSKEVYLKKVNLDDLGSYQKKALLKAQQAMENAYNPYSGFYVGACLVSITYKYIIGANFENSAYGSCICAERSAIVAANAQGIRRFRSIAIIARGKDFDTKEITAPCGECRQVIYEVSQIVGKDIEIILSTTKMDKIIVTSINELLPLGFGPKDLGIDVTKY